MRRITLPPPKLLLDREFSVFDFADNEASGEITVFHADVGDNVGLLLLLFLKLLPCRNNEDMGNVARIGPCFAEHGEDFRTRCDPCPDILSCRLKQVVL